MPRTSTTRSPRLEPLAAKVPAIIALFWALKLLTTGMGEALSDFMGQTSVPLAALVGVGGFVVALRLQLRAREYRAPVYWFAVMMVINMELATITPPVGLNLFVIMGITGEKNFMEVLKGTVPFMFLITLVLVLVMAFPSLATWLPKH